MRGRRNQMSKPPPKLTTFNLWKRDSAYLRLLMKKLGMRMGETIRYAIKFTYEALTTKKSKNVPERVDDGEYLPPGER